MLFFTKQPFTSLKYSYASALAWVIAVATAGLTVFYSRLTRARKVMGGMNALRYRRKAAKALVRGMLQALLVAFAAVFILAPIFWLVISSFSPPKDPVTIPPLAILAA